MVSAGLNEREVEIDQPCFDNPSDEACYWKQIAEEYIQKLQDVKDEFDDFQEGSRELEQELETQLVQFETRVNDLTKTKCALEEENEVLKDKLNAVTNESYLQITALQDDNTKLNSIRTEMDKYIRELEQSNDDLERAKRATICSLEDFDSRLNHAIERNVFLENELEEKEELVITVQRLKDEARDLKADLAITNKERHQSLTESKTKLSETENSISFDSHPPSTPTTKAPTATNTVGGKPPDQPLTTTPQRENSIMKEAEKNKTNNIFNRNNTMNTPATPHLNRTNSNTLTPSARISALNIVSDLLRKVGALESKLASCRNFVQDHPRPGKTPHSLHGVSPMIDSPKSKSKSMVKVNV